MPLICGGVRRGITHGCSKDDGSRYCARSEKASADRSRIACSNIHMKVRPVAAVGLKCRMIRGRTNNTHRVFRGQVASELVYNLYDHTLMDHESCPGARQETTKAFQRVFVNLQWRYVEETQSLVSGK